MSDIPILSNTTSALYNTLSQGASVDPYVYRLSSPWPNNSKTKIVTQPTSQMNFNQQCIFKIPRYGLLQAAAIKVQINLGARGVAGQNGADANTATKLISDELALFFCNKISLTSHSKEIEALTPYSQLAKFLHMSREQQAGLSDAMQRGFDPLGGGDNMDISPASQTDAAGHIAGAEIVTFYIPLLFSFTDSISTALDVSFLEELEIVCDVARKQDLFGVGEGFQAAVTLESSQLICYYHNLDNKHQKALQDAQFNLSSGAPLTCLYANAFEENSIAMTAAAAGDILEFTLNLSCKHLVFETCVSAEVNAGYAEGNRPYTRGTGSQAQIVSAELFMSGRSIWRTTGIESTCLESALLGNQRGRSPGLMNGAVTNDARMVCICWSNDVKEALSGMTGALSFKGASSPQLIVRVKAAEPTAHNLYVTHRYYSATSFSGSDGRVSSGLNL